MKEYIIFLEFMNIFLNKSYSYLTIESKHTRFLEKLSGSTSLAAILDLRTCFPLQPSTHRNLFNHLRNSPLFCVQLDLSLVLFFLSFATGSLRSFPLVRDDLDAQATARIFRVCVRGFLARKKLRSRLDAGSQEVMAEHSRNNECEIRCLSSATPGSSN